MQKTKRALTILLTALIVASSFAGCGNGGAGPSASGDAAASPATPSGKNVEIRLLSGWTNSGEGVNPDNVVINQMIEEFNAQDNGVTIVHEPIAGDDKRNKARLDVTANNACEVWHFWGGSILKDYIKEGVLGDIDDYLGDSEKIKREDYPQVYWDTETFDGVTYAVPYTLATSVFMVNKELFEQYGQEYPTTMEELKAVSQVFADAGLAATNIGSKGGNPSHFFFSDIVCQYGGGQQGIEEMIDNYNFNTPQNMKALEICADLAANSVYPKDTMANGDWSPSYELFTQGNAAMCYTFNWMFSRFPEDMLDKIEIIGVPAASDSEISPQSFQQGWINDANVITAKALADPEKRAAAIKVFDFMNWDIASRMAEIGGIVSPNDAITKTVDYSSVDMGLLGKVMQWRMANSIEGRPNHWANCPTGDLQAYYQSTLDELWAGSITAQEAMDKIQKRFDEEKANA